MPTDVVYSLQGSELPQRASVCHCGLNTQKCGLYLATKWKYQAK